MRLLLVKLEALLDQLTTLRQSQCQSNTHAKTTPTSNQHPHQYRHGPGEDRSCRETPSSDPAAAIEYSGASSQKYLRDSTTFPAFWTSSKIRSVSSGVMVTCISIFPHGFCTAYTEKVTKDNIFSAEKMYKHDIISDENNPCRDAARRIRDQDRRQALPDID